jgi:glycosyltransferase involved in cell wall biosynthesis
MRSHNQSLDSAMNNPFLFHGRLGLQQRLLPAYRIPFFDALASSCQGGLGVYAGQPQSTESVQTASNFKKVNFYQGHNHYLFPVSSPLCLVWQAGLTKWIKEIDPDALIVEANLRNMVTPTIVKWMQGQNRPVIGWGLGIPKSNGLVGRLQNHLWKNFINLFDVLIAYSQRGAAEYSNLRFPVERILVASNAVTYRPTQPIPERPDRWEDRPGVLFVGRLQTRKRVDQLLYACANLPVELQPRLVIIGDGPIRSDLEDLARKVYPGAKFVGAKTNVELSPYFIAADLFVLPGTGGLAIQEAMAYGLPVIVAQGDGTQADLVRPENGWLIPPDDLVALKTTLFTALKDANRLRIMGKESYHIVTEEVNIERMVDVFVHGLQLGVRPRS